ncbi:MAG: hypothetical protein AAF519_15900, partial [Bacteroidota bacterium]
MTSLKTSGLALLTGGALLVTTPKQDTPELKSLGSYITSCNTQNRCVFRTLFGEEESEFVIPKAARHSIDKGLSWIAKAQLANGGWGAGSHQRQDILDPHAVQADPATTSMVAMALLRTGNTLHQGEFSDPLNKALNFIL